MTEPSLNMIRTGPQGQSPVILIHPVGLDLTYWDFYIDALSETYDVVAFDLPGQGLSPGSPPDWTLGQATALLADLVGSTSRLPAHIVGLSVGGMLAQSLALTHPGLVCSLSLFDTASEFSHEARNGMRARADLARTSGMASVLESTLERWFMDSTRQNRPHLIDRVSKTLLRDDAAVHAAMWEMISKFDVTAQLERLECPTLILVGQFDPSSPVTAARILADQITDSRMHIIADASHMAPLEKPVVVLNHLKNFLAEVVG